MARAKSIKGLAPDIKANKGKTEIVHFAKSELGVTFTEYVFINFLDWKYNVIHDRYPIYGADLYKHTTIPAKMWFRLVMRCKAKGLIEKVMLYKDDKPVMVPKERGSTEMIHGATMIPTDKWHAPFKKYQQQVEDKFAPFWNLKEDDVFGNGIKISVHLGNRKLALKAFMKSIKKVSIEELTEKFKLYVKWCRETKTFQKHTSSWLNPDYEHWNNDLSVGNKPDEPKRDGEVKHEVKTW